MRGAHGTYPGEQLVDVFKGERALDEVQTVCALTMLGFGVFAPIFPLFAQGVWLSVFAAIFLILR